MNIHLSCDLSLQNGAPGWSEAGTNGQGPSWNNGVWGPLAAIAGTQPTDNIFPSVAIGTIGAWSEATIFRSHSSSMFVHLSLFHIIACKYFFLK